MDIDLPHPTVIRSSLLDYLEDAGIPCGDLAMVEYYSQNMIFTDHENVFVKVYRRTDGVNEGSNTRVAMANGMPTPKLITDESDWFIVFEYRKMKPITMKKLPVLLAALKDFHDNTRGENLLPDMDWHSVHGVIAGRYANHPEHATRKIITDLSERVTTFLREATTDVDQVFIHNDFSFRNMGESSGHPYIYDWEICTNSIPEVELARIETSMMEADIYDKKFLRSTYGKLDRELLDYSNVLRFCQNIAFNVDIGQGETAARQLEYLGRYYPKFL